MNVRLLQQVPVLFPEAAAKFELAGENAILGQSPEFDIAIQDDDFMTGFPERGSNGHAGRTRTGHNDHMLVLCAHPHHDYEKTTRKLTVTRTLA
jgi:hypothetical protein